MVDIIDENSYTKIIYHAPTRGLLGYRSEFINDTKGQGILLRKFVEYKPFKGEIPSRNTGVLISCETGKAMTYALWNIQEKRSIIYYPTNRSM